MASYTPIEHPHGPQEIQCRPCQAKHPKTGKACTRNSCKTWPYCQQHLKLILGLQVKKSTIAGAGCGLFVAQASEMWSTSEQVLTNLVRANEDIAFKASQPCISPYTGELLTKTEEFARQDAYNTHGRYLIAQGSKSLDSIRTSEGPARFANHKKQSQTNANLAMVPTSLKKDLQPEYRNVPWLLASKPLRVGDEIFVNQGPDQDFQFQLQPDEKKVRSLCR